MSPRQAAVRPGGGAPKRVPRRAPVRQRPVRRRRKWVPRTLVALAFAAGAVQLTYAARHAGALTIDTIAITGHAQVSEGELLGLLGSLPGQDLLDADIESARVALLASGWIRDATLRRVIPSTVEVKVVERTPFALARFGEWLYLIDADGYLIDQLGPRYAEIDLPIIDGLPPPDAAGDGVVSGVRAALAARLVAELVADPPLAARVSQIDVSDPHDAVVLLSGDPALIRLGEGSFAERLRAYVDVAQAIRSGVPLVDTVDMRFGRQVYVRPLESDGRGAAFGKGRP